MKGVSEGFALIHCEWVAIRGLESELFLCLASFPAPQLYIYALKFVNAEDE